MLVRSRYFGGLNRGLQNLELPERERFYSFRLYEKNGEYPRGLRTSGLRGRFKALPEKILAKFSDGTSRNRFFAQNGGEKALNRGRRTESRVLFGYFLHNAKSDKPFSLAGSSEVLRTSNQHTKLQIRTNKIKSFAASRQCPCRDSTLRVLFPPPLVAFFGGSAAFFLLFV